MCIRDRFNVVEVQFPNVGTIGITVNQAHNALRVSYKLPDPSYVQSGIRTGYSMNFDKIVTERVGPVCVDFLEMFWIVHHRLEVFKIDVTIDVFRQCEEFVDIAQGNGASIVFHCSHVNRTNMTWEW